MPLIDAVALHNEIAKDAKLTDGERDLMLDYIDSAPLVEIEQKWIPITERLPEWLDYVIVHYENGNVRISMMINEKRFSCEGLYGKVTHWMPLPAPPVTE